MPNSLRVCKRHGAICRLSLRERMPFRGAKGDKASPLCSAASRRRNGDPASRRVPSSSRRVGPFSPSDRPPSRSTTPSSRSDRPCDRREASPSRSGRPTSRSERPASRREGPTSRSGCPCSRGVWTLPNSRNINQGLLLSHFVQIDGTTNIGENVCATGFASVVSASPASRQHGQRQWPPAVSR